MILRKEYYFEIENLITNRRLISQSISALVYNIDLDIANQIPISQYLRNIFTNEKNTNDINKYRDHAYFLDVLPEIIKSLESTLIARAINIMNNLKTKGLSDNENAIDIIWDYLNSQLLRSNREIEKFEEIYKILLIKNDKENRKSLLKYLCTNIQKFRKKTGAQYYKALSELEKFMLENKISLDVVSYLKEKEVTAENFINYVETAQNNYGKYKLSCGNDRLNSFLIELLPSELKYSTIFEYLKGSNYNFDKFFSELESHISAITADNFYHLNYSYKLLSSSKPLKIQLDSGQIPPIQSIINDNTKDGFYDICAMAIGYNIATPINADNENDIQEISDRIEYYFTYGDLLSKCISHANPVLNKILIDITTNKRENSHLVIDEVLLQFVKLRKLLEIESNVFLDRLNEWTDDATQKINEENIQEKIPYQFYKYSLLTKNELTQYIHEIAINKLKKVDFNVLFKNRNDASNYWINTSRIFIEGKILTSLADNLVEFVKIIFIDISTSGTIPNEIVQPIINKIAPSRITATIKSILREYYSGTKNINPDMFRFFEQYFRDPNRIEKHEDDFTGTVLDKVIQDKQCRDIILEHGTFYSKIVNLAKDDAEEFKIKIKNIYSSEPSEKLKIFSDAIGIKMESQGE